MIVAKPCIIVPTCELEGRGGSFKEIELSELS
jgi:hypothetical protein